MGKQLSKHLIIICIAITFGGCGIHRTVMIDSEPPEAHVSIDNISKEPTPYQERLKWSEKTIHTITLKSENYETKSIDLNYEKALDAEEPWKINFELELLFKTFNVKFLSIPTGAEVVLGGRSVGKTPFEQSISFSRNSSSEEWTTHLAIFRLENYGEENITLKYENIKKTPVVQQPLVLTSQKLPLDITTNIDPAVVEINGKVIGQTPLRHIFEFSRENKHSEWNTFFMVVSKDGYRYRVPNSTIPPGENPPYSKRLTVNSGTLRSGTLNLKHFEQIRFIYTKILRYRPTPEGFVREEETVLAQVGEIEREPKVQSVTRITDAPLSQPFSETRIDVLADSETVLYSFPYNNDPDNNSMNLWLQKGAEKTRLTDSDKMDMEGVVSHDGQWIYFTANRSGTRKDPLRRSNLWRIQTTGRGGFTKITDSTSSQIDTEVAVSPDGTKIAFMSILIGIKSPHIWTANADGSLPTQLRIGRKPCWSPDNKKIVFQAPDAQGGDRIWVMQSDGSDPTQLTVGDFDDTDPEWSPDGKRIIYASNQALNEEGIPNFDIWIMNADGSNKTQLTINGSYDYRPTISPNGKYVYFLSNRGARRAGQRYLQIWRIELPEDL